MDALAGQVNGEAEEWRIRYEELDNAHQDLRTQLLQQEKVTSEVKQEATGFLQQMKALSERSNQSCEGEERLIHQVQFLEKRIQEWKSRYARTRTQMGILRASSTATSIEQVDAVQVAKDGGFIAPDGLVKDVHIATFQIAIDELLQSARENEPTSVLGHVRSVAVAVREIILDIGDTQISKDEVTQQKHKLRAKVSATANNVITASRNYASSKGLSPVSLLDAAASHLTAAIVGLVQFVKICPTPVEDFDNEDEESVNGDFSSSYYGISSSLTGVGTDSAYPVSDLQSSAQPKSKGYPQSKPVQNGESDGIRYSTEPKRTHGIYTTPNNEMEELKVRYFPITPSTLRYPSNCAH